MVRIESLGSIWLVDGGRRRYMRMPRTEEPRERPEWGDERAGPCQDLVWHPLDSWWVTADERRLVVVPVLAMPFWVPLTSAVRDETFDVVGEVMARGDGTYERIIGRLCREPLP